MEDYLENTNDYFSVDRNESDSRKAEGNLEAAAWNDGVEWNDGGWNDGGGWNNSDWSNVSQ